MIIRIPLDETNSTTRLRYASDIDTPDNPAGTGSSQNPDDNDNNNSDSGFILPQAEFSLNHVEIERYASAQYAFPVTPVNITVPDDDKAVVSSWFANSSSTQAVSDTLVKRMTTAVMGAMRTLWDDAARLGLFTRPFRIGYALLTADGHLVHPSAPVTLFPDTRAPVMALHDVSLSGDILSTRTEIRNPTCRLQVTLRPFTLPAGLKERVTHLVFYATEQANPLTGNEQVTAVRTFVIDGKNSPGWYYTRLSEEQVAGKAAALTGFRIIGSIPAAQAESGIEGLELPSGKTDLTDWSNFPKAGESSDPETPGMPRPVSMEIDTAPLDLHLPETDKRILALTARGIFSRHPDSVFITLYGAHHRPESGISQGEESATTAPPESGWRKIAAARGPHIRLLRGIRYRWLRVVLTLPYPSRIDALTFLLK